MPPPNTREPKAHHQQSPPHEGYLVAALGWVDHALQQEKMQDGGTGISIWWRDRAPTTICAALMTGSDPAPVTGPDIGPRDFRPRITGLPSA
jgi:hypothetical protein